MKERPILFSAPMVRALLAGTKTQTRRAFRDQPPPGSLVGWVPGQSTTQFGREGDRLWVRENGWERPYRTAKMMREGADTWEPYYFDADGLLQSEVEDFKRWGFKRRPSIHMPRWASRIALELTGVRIERLNDISEADCIAEGIEKTAHGFWSTYGQSHVNGTYSPTASFRFLWESINGPGSWGVNPWVWAIEFRRI